MRHLLFLAFLSFLICFGCNNPSDSSSTNSHIEEEGSNDWKNLKLKGQVKAVKEIKFLAVDNFSEIVKGEKVRHIYNKEYLFNLDGYKIEENDYIPDGTLANRIMYLYKQNKLIEFNEYDSQGLLFGTGKYEIGENSFPNKLNYKTSDGRYNWSETFTYDDNDNIIEVSHFNAENILESKEVYKYNAKGMLIESELYKDNKLISKNKYTNDKEGTNSALNYSGDSSQYTYVYNYDSKGNWIKKIVFENNNPSGILIREIEYFN